MFTLPAGYPADPIAAFALLKTRRRLDLDDLKVLAMIECYGEVFYLNMANAVGHPEAGALLARNGHEERGHAHRLLKAIALLGDAGFVLPERHDNPFLQREPRAVAPGPEFLEMLVSGEEEGDQLYQGWAAAEPNEEIARLYRQNAAEETRHGERVAQVKRLLQPTAAP
jgi:rubrerythrin